MKRFRFGKAFVDEIIKTANRTGGFHKNKGSGNNFSDIIFGQDLNFESTNIASSLRKTLMLSFVMVCFSILFFRLFNLQIINGEKNRERADFNRIQVKVIHAPRGVIYDRSGKILAQNEPGFRLIETNGDNSPKVSYIQRDEALKMEVEKDPRFEKLEIDNIRSYPLGKKTAHILGYVSEITQEELLDPKYGSYKLGDKIGRSGIEEVYEKVLKGVDGGEVVEVDAQGKFIRSLRKKEATAGQNLYLNIDVPLQIYAFDLMEEAVKKAQTCCGALVIQNPQNGQILALVSVPSFDPLKIEEFLVSENSPLLNRVIAGSYPPGSTFKIASGLAGLASGKITKNTLVEDTGVINLGPFKFTNWYFTQYGKTEGSVDLIKALKRSNDIYFYRVGQITGEKKLAETARDLGLGEKLGIDLPGEVLGVIPDNEWKVKNIGEIWFPGDSLHMAIGQGFVLTTPLQVSHLISTIASDGKQYPPSLAAKITDPFGKTIKEFKFDSLSGQKYKLSDLKIIKQGLEEVPKNGGTAWPFFTFPIQTGGKTGTAEFGDPKGKTHAWYTSYAPTNNPEIAATVLIEKGGEGSSVASPVVKEIYRYYFSKDKSNLIKDITPTVATESARSLGE